MVAFDAAGDEVAFLESPLGGLDGLPWTWSMTAGGGVTISSLEITKIGDEHLHGFGFDDFDTTNANASAMTHTVPIPAALASPQSLSVLAAASVDVETRTSSSPRNSRTRLSRPDLAGDLREAFGPQKNLTDCSVRQLAGTGFSAIRGFPLANLYGKMLEIRGECHSCAGNVLDVCPRS